MSRLSPTPPILSLLPALALLPVLISILISFHNGGVTLLWEFICAAVHPSIQAEVVQSVFRGRKEEIFDMIYQLLVEHKIK